VYVDDELTVFFLFCFLFFGLYSNSLPSFVDLLSIPLRVVECAASSRPSHHHLPHQSTLGSILDKFSGRRRSSSTTSSSNGGGGGNGSGKSTNTFWNSGDYLYNSFDHAIGDVAKAIEETSALISSQDDQQPHQQQSGVMVQHNGRQQQNGHENNDYDSIEEGGGGKAAGNFHQLQQRFFFAVLPVSS
jgi:hypothetical protein